MRTSRRYREVSVTVDPTIRGRRDYRQAAPTELRRSAGATVTEFRVAMRRRVDTVPPLTQPAAGTPLRTSGTRIAASAQWE
jgi:hypothetical protein